MTHILTKSMLLSATQCHRRLWLEVRRPDLLQDEDGGAERRKREGIRVGELACAGTGPLIIKPLDLASKAVSAERAKQQMLSNPLASGIEVPMHFKGVYARADALLPDGAGGYALQETKATTFPLKADKVTPGKPSLEHVTDLAIQAWVMENSGIPMSRAELNLIDNRWKYPGAGDYRGLFRVLDVTAEVREALVQVPGLVDSARATVSGSMPSVATGKQCKSPHGCPFFAYCQSLDPSRPAHPLELLPDAAGKALAAKLKCEKGYQSLLEPAAHEFTGANAPLYVRMQEAHRTGVPYLSEDSADALAPLPYPRHYFDFEGIDLAVPVWKGVRPYEQVTFQWSCHIERAPGRFELAEFLDLSGQDPSVPCIEQMLTAIDPGSKSPIFVYFATYERGRLQELATRHPQYAPALQRYITRLVDLLPLVKEHFYHPLMKGSFSIKEVLPVIAPDLDYSRLTEVSDGVAAQLAYIKAALRKGQSAKEAVETETNARIYCRQDTWAMVEVAYFLAQNGRPLRPAGM